MVSKRDAVYFSEIPAWCSRGSPSVETSTRARNPRRRAKTPGTAHGVVSSSARIYTVVKWPSNLKPLTHLPGLPPAIKIRIRYFGILDFK